MIARIPVNFNILDQTISVHNNNMVTSLTAVAHPDLELRRGGEGSI